TCSAAHRNRGSRRQHGGPAAGTLARRTDRAGRDLRAARSGRETGGRTGTARLEDRGGVPVNDLQNRIAVAIDGPAGSGKSSVSRAAARALGFDYQDTGAAYRALAWHVRDRGADATDPASVTDLLDSFDYDIGTDPDHYFVRVGARDVTEAIRHPEVSAVVSGVAAIPAVREALTAIFRDRIERSGRPGIITEGRDITTVVAPD